MNWFDAIDRLDKVLREFYLSTVGKDDPQLKSYAHFAAGYYRSMAATLLYKLDEDQAMEDMAYRRKSLREGALRA